MRAAILALLAGEPRHGYQIIQVLAATRQVAQAGTTAQVKGAQDVLRTARKGIYRLLAEDDAEA